METRSLYYFIAVAEVKNIGRAAVRLHMTQPALTRQIKSLEEELGVPLFIRTASGVEMTPSGEALLQHARNIRTELELAKRNTHHANMDVRRRLDVGVFGSAIFNVIPQILNQFSKANPGVELVLHNARKDQQIEALRQGKILIAFDRFFPEEPDLVRNLVCIEHLVLALHRDHRLAIRQVVELSELCDEPLIGAHEKARDAELSKLFGFTPKVEQRVDDLLTALAMVGCGYGVTFAPISIQTLQVPNVVYRPIVGGLKFPFDLQCIYRKNEQSLLLHAMLETVHTFRESSNVTEGMI